MLGFRIAPRRIGMRMVKLAVGCAVVALAAGSQLSRLPVERRGELLSTFRGLVGGAASATPIVVTLPVSATSPARSLRPEAASLGPTEAIGPDRGGQFQTTVEIDGQRLAAMVDTGATYLSLSFEDADRVGIRPLPSDYRYPVSTANGRAFVAKVRLGTVRLGTITVRDVTAMVAERGQMSGSLLGMSFLSRLSGMKVDHGRLVLEQ
jgi:aspartyl protease family protein